MRTATRRAPGLAGFAKTRAERQLVEALVSGKLMNKDIRVLR
jgi:hypothetical protein